MKTKFLVLIFCAFSLILNAQEQSGIVKTIGRPGQPGVPLENVFVRVQGAANASVSDEMGAFSILLANYKTGQAYRLSRVSRNGYQLADKEIIGRQYPYSEDIPLEISMISNEEYERTRMEIESAVRCRIDAEYQARMTELQQQLEDKSINEEMHIKKITELNDSYDNADILIERLADRYARTDYDRLDSIDARINSLIEQGKLDEAERLIQNKGTKKALDQLIENNKKLESTLEAGKRAEAEMVQRYASELYMQFDIAALRFDNVSAAGYLKERMELDSTNYRWKMDYASFIKEYLGKYDEAFDIYQVLLDTADNLEITAELYGNIGNIYHLKGQYEDALESYKKSAEIRECDSVSRKDLATSYSNISSVYLTLEHYEDAYPYLNKAETLFKEYNDTLGLAGVYNKRMIIYYDRGEYELAEEELNKSIDLRVKVLGEDNLKVASEYVNAAILFKKLGRLDEALDYVGKAIMIRRKILGEMHPYVADAYHVCGMVNMAKGEYASVLQYYDKALDIYLQSYNEFHPDIASIYGSKASYYNEVVNDYEKAVEFYLKEIEISERLFGKKHSSVAISLSNIAGVYQSLAQYDKALVYYERALQIRKQVFGETHPETGAVLNNIAILYYHLGHYQDSKAYFEKVLSIWVDTYGEMHPDVALVYSNLGAICNELNDDQTALEYSEKALNIYKAVYGDTHPSIARTYDVIGSIFHEYKMYDQAEQFMLLALQVRESYWGTDHIDLALSYNNLSSLYQSKGEFEKSEEVLNKALNIQKAVYGDKHPNVATIFSNFASLYMELKQYDKALEYLSFAIDIVESAYEADHPRVRLYRYALGNLMHKMKQYDEALSEFKALYRSGINHSGFEDDNAEASFIVMHRIYVEIMGDKEYLGGYDDEYVALNKNTLFYATVAEGYQAEKMGLSGDYDVVAYEEWSIDDDKTNFLVFTSDVSAREKKTYVFHRDGEFIPITFEGSLGVWLNPKWISENDKEDLIKSYKKWHRKHRN